MLVKQFTLPLPYLTLPYLTLPYLGVLFKHFFILRHHFHEGDI